MVKDFTLAKVLYSCQWTWTLCCLTDINLAVSVWVISVSFPPRGTVHKSEQWHQFPNRPNTTACLTYKALSNLTVVKVPISQCLGCILFSFLRELQSKHWYACILHMKSPVKRTLYFQPPQVSRKLVSVACREEARLGSTILSLSQKFPLFKSQEWNTIIPFFRSTFL